MVLLVLVVLPAATAAADVGTRHKPVLSFVDKLCFFLGKYKFPNRACRNKDVQSLSIGRSEL